MIIKRNKKDGEFMFSGDMMNIANFIFDYAKNWSSFKIGKSSKSVEERFSEPDYNGEYDGIVEVYASSSAVNVSRMEASLINYFMDNKKCDNKKDGISSVNDAMASSSEYIVYVVYKL